MKEFGMHADTAFFILHYMPRERKQDIFRPWFWELAEEY